MFGCDSVHTGKAAPSSAQTVCELSAAKTLNRRGYRLMPVPVVAGGCFRGGGLQADFAPFSPALQHKRKLETREAYGLSMLGK